MAEYEVLIMIVKFDSLNRFEVPQMYICNPGSVYNANGTVSNTIGILNNTSDEEIIFNFNAMSELNFRAYKVTYESPEENTDALKKYKSLQNRRVIFVGDIGFFVITQAIDGYSDGQDYKDISAKSCEVEIENKRIPYIENKTYAFTELLEMLVAILPRWTIGNVHDSIANKYRTFEDVTEDKNILSFFMEDMQEAYECIFDFDIINRVINVYDQNDFVVQTPIHFTKNDFINSLEITENSEDLYTSISVMGDENLNIVAVNPLGTNTIYNFDYYLSWMSDELSEKVQAWQQLVNDNFNNYYNLNLQYYDKLTAQNDYKYEIDKLNAQLVMYQRCRENIVAESSTNRVEGYNTIIEANGGKPIQVKEEIADTLNYIETLIAETQDLYTDAKAKYDEYEEELVVYRGEILDIQEQVSFETYFTQAEYDELYNFIYEGSYQDEYITVTESMTYSERFEQMKTLYDRAVNQLNKISKPTQEFSIDLENFLFVKEFEELSNQLSTGSLINIELEFDDVAALFLSSISINYYDKSLSMTFGNRFNKFDPKSLFNNVLGDVKKSANSINYIKDVLYPITSGKYNELEETVNNSRTLTKNAALSSTNEDVIIDETGYTGRKILDNGVFDPHQVKITGNNIVFTDDAWDTCKLALGELILGDNETAYGVNAQVLIGDIIMGRNLRILDSENKDIFTVVDGKISASVDDIDGRLTKVEATAGGLEIRVKDIEDTETSVDHVTTETGYTFGADGLLIKQEGAEITNKLDHTGMYVTRSGGDKGDDEILTANNDGVNAINLTARQYLVIGNHSRLENYVTSADANRTACFYITTE